MINQEKLIAAVIRYEQARKRSSELKKQRAELLRNCEVIQASRDQYGRIDYEIQPCLYKVHEELMTILKENGGGYSFEEVMYNMKDDECCQSCIAAYQLKKGDLAIANAEFGKAKIHLSLIGKSLIKQSEKAE